MTLPVYTVRVTCEGVRRYVDVAAPNPHSAMRDAAAYMSWYHGGGVWTATGYQLKIR